MLPMPAFELGHPVAFVIEVKAGDCSSHAWGSVTRRVGGSADDPETA
jgi:hypothetical protein